jgi:Fur family ferric uptake transcriptional regulator
MAAHAGEADLRVTPLERACAAAGMRMTLHRRILCRALTEANDHPDAMELRRRCLVHDPNVSSATIYRSLAHMVAYGLVVKHDFGLAAAKSRARYELGGRLAHGHFIDIETGDVQEFSLDEFIDAEAALARRLGCVVTARRVEIFGRTTAAAKPIATRIARKTRRQANRG